MKKHIRFNAVKPLQLPQLGDNKKHDLFDCLLLTDKRRTQRVIKGKKPIDSMIICDDVDIIGRDSENHSI
jgi:hypothetical protein